jgi:hypothetical protein
LDYDAFVSQAAPISSKFGVPVSEVSSLLTLEGGGVIGFTSKEGKMYRDIPKGFEGMSTREGEVLIPIEKPSAPTELTEPQLMAQQAQTQYTAKAVLPEGPSALKYTQNPETREWTVSGIPLAQGKQFTGQQITADLSTYIFGVPEYDKSPLGIKSAAKGVSNTLVFGPAGFIADVVGATPKIIDVAKEHPVELFVGTAGTTALIAGSIPGAFYKTAQGAAQGNPYNIGEAVALGVMATGGNFGGYSKRVSFAEGLTRPRLVEFEPRITFVSSEGVSMPIRTLSQAKEVPSVFLNREVGVATLTQRGISQVTSSGESVRLGPIRKGPEPILEPGYDFTPKFTQTAKVSGIARDVSNPFGATKFTGKNGVVVFGEETMTPSKLGIAQAPNEGTSISLGIPSRGKNVGGTLTFEVAKEVDINKILQPPRAQGQTVDFLRTRFKIGGADETGLGQPKPGAITNVAGIEKGGDILLYPSKRSGLMIETTGTKEVQFTAQAQKTSARVALMPAEGTGSYGLTTTKTATAEMPVVSFLTYPGATRTKTISAPAFSGFAGFGPGTMAQTVSSTKTISVPRTISAPDVRTQTQTRTSVAPTTTVFVSTKPYVIAKPTTQTVPVTQTTPKTTVGTITETVTGQINKLASSRVPVPTNPLVPAPLIPKLPASGGFSSRPFGGGMPSPKRRAGKFRRKTGIQPLLTWREKTSIEIGRGKAVSSIIPRTKATVATYTKNLFGATGSSGFVKGLKIVIPGGKKKRK